MKRSLLFSVVTLTTDDMEKELLVGGIPHSVEDLYGWEAFDDFLDDAAGDAVFVHAEGYIYGEGETDHADESELAQIAQMMSEDSSFLAERCDNIEDVDFSFVELAEEDEEEWEM